MKAGRWVNDVTSSVSPLVTTDVQVAGKEEVTGEEEDVPGLWDPDTEDEGGPPGEDTDEEDFPEEMSGDIAERIGLEKEGKFIRKLIDPKLPTQEEVNMHNLMGHVEYRSWCGICVRCRGKDMDHKAQKDKERKFPEYSFD